MHYRITAEDSHANVTIYLDKNRKQVGAAGLVKEVCYICILSHGWVHHLNCLKPYGTCLRQVSGGLVHLKLSAEAPWRRWITSVRHRSIVRLHLTQTLYWFWKHTCVQCKRALTDLTFTHTGRMLQQAYLDGAACETYIGQTSSAYARSRVQTFSITLVPCGEWCFMQSSVWFPLISLS